MSKYTIILKPSLRIRCLSKQILKTLRALSVISLMAPKGSDSGNPVTYADSIELPLNDDGSDHPSDDAVHPNP